MSGIIKISSIRLALAYVFIIIVLSFIRYRGIKKEKEIIISTFRMSVQLVLTGFVLKFIFSHPSPILSVIIVTAMEFFAIHTVIRKFRNRASADLKKIAAVSLLVGTSISLFYFLLVIVGLKPWFNPQYFIPIAGMIIGNSMTGVSLGMNSMIESMSVRKAFVNEALVLGASPKEASKEIVDKVFESAIMPTVNSMLGMGIVFLPGMMTGQILSGTVPTTAISYQIAIMLGILGSVSITLMLFLSFGYKTFFSKQDQLKEFN